MKKRKIGIGWICCVLASCCAGSLLAWDSYQNEIQLTAGVQTSITENVGLKVTEEWRTMKDFLGESGYSSYYWHTEVVAPLTYIKGISIEPGFRWIQVRNSSGWQTDYLFLLSGTKVFGLGAKFSLAARARFCLNENDSKPVDHHLHDAWEFRPMLTLRYGGFDRITPYFAYELYYNMSDDFWFLNRLYTGLSYRFTSAFSAYGDVVKQDGRAYRDEHWEGKWIFRAGVKFRF
ncbi:hypothetical protein [Puniceicoccus vermicola]|uniref:Lipoprotein n=1 Tax=Puniceicoccus vermicola TaxID=388746 RepID=A0A7X1AYZ2_9BACT|nr:hypothetical protein [Puniceicoccus vermicola]MBC2601425.1 hypothetical protein [Puniceicoccus vermicola]